MAKNAAEKNSNISSDRLLTILECISINDSPIRLQDLAEQVGMTSSTVLRYLRTLQNANYIYQDEDTLRYARTWKVCALASNLNSFFSLRTIATPFVNELASKLHRGVCLTVNQDNQCLYLDCIEPSTPMLVPLQYVGKRAPLHVTASGKTLLAAYNDQQLDEYITQTGLVPYTPNSITDQEQLKKELAEIRRNGYAIDNEECEVNMRGIAYPIYCFTNNVYAGISVFGYRTSMNDDFINESVKPYLQKVSREISSRLGYQSNS